TALAERFVDEQRAAFVHQQVEQHETRRRFTRKLCDAACGRMQAQLQRGEGTCAADIDDEFAVEYPAFCFQLREHRDDFGEVAAERLSGFRRERYFIAIAFGEAAEAIPLRFVAPLNAFGQL